jgi:uncharacterized SAM-binding protein YcdF (DUF218 family)
MHFGTPPLKAMFSRYQSLVKRVARLRLAQRRTVWCPTWLGLFCIAVLLVIPAVWWWSCGESFLSVTRRLPAKVLVVEGWIGRTGIRAARAEFEEHGYQYIAPTGGLTSGFWEDGLSNYAEMAARELIRLGVPTDKIVVSATTETESHRTFESAVAVRRVLEARGIRPTTLDVFTFGPHAMRSALVFTKVLGPKTNVGVVAWLPSIYKTEPWWRSSKRAKQFLEESVGYLYEVLLNSGRRSNDPAAEEQLAGQKTAVRISNK